MLLTLGAIPLAAWLVGLVVFHAGGLIHSLPVLAVRSLLFHVTTGRSPRTI